jgi:bacterioferritin-associated ferredoxin
MITEKQYIADEIMCSCSGTTRGKINDLVQQGMDVEAISRWTGAKTGCGGCDWDIEVFVRALNEAKTQNL